jgi:predicted dehydrogenase
VMSDSRLPLRFGIIGCGALGLVHAQRLSAMPGVEVVAVSDPDPQAMQRVAASVSTSSAVASFADYNELLKTAKIDAICINSPNRWHVEQLLASLNRGLHVLCEKPLSMVPTEVEQVVSATERAGTTVAIAYQSRYRRDSITLRRALQSGQWGRVTSIDVFTCEDWMTPNRGTWRHDPDRCPGGFFADANGHQLDLLFWLTGLEASTIRATTETRGTRVPMVTWGEARLRPQRSQGVAAASDPGAEGDGIPFTFTFVGDAKHWREEISIQTEKADFVMHDTRLIWTDGTREPGPYADPDKESDAASRAYTPDAAFVAALRGGPPVSSPPHTVWPVLNFTLAALESAGRGEPVKC